MTEKAYIGLNAVNIITISIAALLGYGVLVAAVAAMNKIKPGAMGGA